MTDLEVEGAPVEVSAPVRIPYSDLEARAGTHLGRTAWHTVDQAQINAFADATGDHQWIHVDPERAADGPFGRTVAHGYLTLSLAPMLLWEIMQVDGASVVVNYGLNRVRFPAPLPVGSSVRASVDCMDVEQVRGGKQVTLLFTVEVEGYDKPCCVAEILFRYYG
jgi:acyl dehydratase